MKKPRIVRVNYGISSVYSDGTIEIHKKLKNPLAKQILAHEKRHLKGEYRMKDFRNDFMSKKPYFFKSLRIALKNPEMLIGFMPVMFSYYRKQWTFNLTSIFPLLLYGLIFSGVTWLLLKINFIYTFLFFLYIILAINVSLLLYTHYYVAKNGS